MKKYLFGSAIATLMLAACSDDQTVDAPASANEISFQASLENVSRANTEPGYPPSEFAVTAIGNDANFFTDLMIRGGKGSPYKPSDGGAYHFPNYHLTFFAYSPVDFGGTPEITPEGQKLTGITVKDNPMDHVDLIVAEDNREALGETVNTVNMKFKHAMSAVQVRVTSTNPAMKYEVAGIRLACIKSTGDFTYPVLADDYDLELSNSDWSNLSGPKTFTSSNTSPVQFIGSANSPSSYTAMKEGWPYAFKIIPQNLSKSGAWTKGATADGAYIAIKCKMWVRDNQYNTLSQFFPEKGDKYGLVAVPVNINFEPGKFYTITVDMANGGRLDPAPGAVSDPDIDPDPLPGKKGGDLVSNGDIRISHSFNPFIETDNVNKPF